MLYFYPKDDTPGCTTQALDFTAAKRAFARVKTDIVGISADSAARHEKFKAKHDIGITLLSDPDKQAIGAYGVWVQKQLYGREYMGIERATFLIDAKGKIRHIWRKVRVKGHVDAVLALAKDAQI